MKGDNFKKTGIKWSCVIQQVAHSAGTGMYTKMSNLVNQDKILDQNTSKQYLPNNLV